MKAVNILTTCVLLSAPMIFAQQNPRAIATAEPRDGATAGAEIGRDQISATVDGKPAAVRDWTRLAGANGALQLYIVIDDGTRSDLANQYTEMRSFMNSQPPSTEIGVAYLQNGVARIAQKLTSDHAAAGKALRIPMGDPGIAASPYMGVSDLIKKWPAAEARREILLITSGADPYYHSLDLQNPYLEKAVSDAQRGAIVVNSIYYGASGHFGHSFIGVNMGQNYLSELAEGTGGEFYWEGLRSPVSISPFMRDFAQRLNAQYLLVLDAAGLKPGFQNLKLTARAPHISLVAPSRIYVPK